jgi:hypothetical protein
MSGDWRVVTVDAATGSLSDPPVLTGKMTVVAADAAGAWTLDLSNVENAVENNVLGIAVLGGLRVGRVDPTGRVIGTDLLRGARFLDPGVAGDPTGLWVTYQPSTAGTGTTLPLRLVHATADGHRVLAKGVQPWSIASGDGQTWFLGSVGRPKLRASGLVDWVLGRLDPRTGKVARAVRLDLPEADHPVGAATSRVPDLRILAVTGDAVWLYAAAPTTDQELIRVDIGRH